MLLIWADSGRTGCVPLAPPQRGRAARGIARRGEADGGADAAFSMEPEEFKEMVDHIRMIEKAVGKVTYDLTPKQKKSREHSRSLFVAQDMKAGDVFTPENLRSVRPSCGLHTRYYEELLGKRITRDARLGTPMDWSLVDFTEKEQQ